MTVKQPCLVLVLSEPRQCQGNYLPLPLLVPMAGKSHSLSVVGLKTMQVQDVLEAAKVLEWLKENCTIEYIKK